MMLTYFCLKILKIDWDIINDSLIHIESLTNLLIGWFQPQLHEYWSNFSFEFCAWFIVVYLMWWFLLLLKVMACFRIQSLAAQVPCWKSRLCLQNCVRTMFNKVVALVDCQKWSRPSKSTSSKRCPLKLTLKIHIIEEMLLSHFHAKPRAIVINNSQLNFMQGYE